MTLNPEPDCPILCILNLYPKDLTCIQRTLYIIYYIYMFIKKIWCVVKNEWGSVLRVSSVFLKCTASLFITTNNPTFITVYLQKHYSYQLLLEGNEKAQKCSAQLHFIQDWLWNFPRCLNVLLSFRWSQRVWGTTTKNSKCLSLFIVITRTFLVCC